MKPKLLTLAFSIIATWFFALAASGEIVTFDFAGGVSFVYNPYGVVSPSLIQVGDPVQVSLRYDTTTYDGYPNDPTRGAFLSPGWLKARINGLDFQSPTAVQVDIIHDSANGGQEFFQALAFPSPTVWPEALPVYPYRRLGFASWETGPPYDFLSSDQLPLTLDFSRADIWSGGISTSTSDLNMYEVQFSLVQVPEPASFVVACLGAAALMIFRWRK